MGTRHETLTLDGETPPCPAVLQMWKQPASPLDDGHSLMLHTHLHKAPESCEAVAARRRTLRHAVAEPTSVCSSELPASRSCSL